MNATGSLAATDDIRWDFVEEFWNQSLPNGRYRYYDGLLYFMALLHLSGNFQIYDPTVAD
jgi:oligosaccharide reducing-end xylanase